MSAETDAALAYTAERLRGLGLHHNTDALVALIAERDSLRAELARIKASPVPDEEIKELAEEFGIWPDDVRKIASRLSSIKPVEVDALNTNEKEAT